MEAHTGKGAPKSKSYRKKCSEFRESRDHEGDRVVREGSLDEIRLQLDLLRGCGYVKLY